MNESSLIASARSGDENAFGKLVNASLAKVLGTARRMLRDDSSAWDAAQDAYFRAWNKLAEFRGDAQFSTWVVTIVTRICLDRLRTMKRRLESEMPESRESEATQPEPAAVTAALGEALTIAVSGLPEAERIVFIMHHDAEMRYREIADKLDIPIGTVMSRLHSARMRLRTALEPWWKEMKS